MKEKTQVELFQENLELAEQLKALNERLNQILDKKPSKKEPTAKMASPRNILPMAQKQLRHYKSEERILKKRLKIISEPEYSLNLQVSVNKMTQKLEELTADNIKLKKNEVKLEKEIEKKLEKIKDQEKNLVLDKEFKFLLNHKIELETMIQNKQEKIQEIRENTEKINKKMQKTLKSLEKIENTLENYPSNDHLVRYRSLETVLSKNQKLSVQSQRFLNMRVSNLALQLKNIQSAESKLSSKFEGSFKTLKRHKSKIKAFTNFYSLQNSPIPMKSPLNLTVKTRLGNTICYSP